LYALVESEVSQPFLTSPSQSSVLVGQAVIRQRPARQRCEASHRRPHAPQFSTSVFGSTHTPPQSSPNLHPGMHVPSAQTSFEPHPCPHAPQ
jgi:hypothetical protein